MNTCIKQPIYYPYSTDHRFWNTVLTSSTFKRRCLSFVLVLSIMCSAFALIYMKDIYRQGFVFQQHLRTQEQHLRIRWQQLLVERGVWSDEHHIQRFAEHRLAMYVPSVRDVVLVRSQSG